MITEERIMRAIGFTIIYLCVLAKRKGKSRLGIFDLLVVMLMIIIGSILISQ